MKILMCHNQYQNPGGEDRSCAAEVALLRHRGHEVIEYLRHNDEIKTRGLLGRAQLYFETTWSRRSYEDILRIIAEEQPNIAHFQNTFPLISPSGYYACREQKVPVVQSLRNYRLLCPGALLMRNGTVCEDCLGNTLKPAVENRCYRNSRLQTSAVVKMLRHHRRRGTYEKMVDRYIALTQFSKKVFSSAGLPEHRIAVKPNLVSAGEPANHGGDYAIFVGRLSAEKGIKSLLKAWGHIAFPLKVVGDGPLRVDVQGFRNGRVQSLGHKAPAETMDLIAGSRFLVLPSVCYETFGRTIVEAFGCARPVIASAHGSLAELVEDGNTGLLFEPGNAEDLAKKVRWMVQHPEACREMGLAARKEYEEKYTPERNYEMLMDIYRQAIERRRGK